MSEQRRSASIPRGQRLVLSVVVALMIVGAVALLMLGTSASPQAKLDSYAEQYVRLALELDHARSGEVDSYFGPERLADRVRSSAAPEVSEIAMRSEQLADDVASIDAVEVSARQSRLFKKVLQLGRVADYLAQPSHATVAEELRLLYGIEVPAYDADVAADALDELAQVLPGRGTLAFRLASFQNRLVIAPPQRRAVFEAALARCRSQTVKFWQLPAEESLVIEWTRDIPAAWHRYEGQYRSTLQINDLSVALVGHAVDLACHEAYPGHHAQFLIMEAAHDAPTNIEDTVVLLRSPGSVLREGAASLAAEIAFAAEERRRFEADELFELGGVPADLAAQAAQVQSLVTSLSGNTIEIIRAYYDGEIDFNAASHRLEREAMVTSSVALLQYVDDYGMYSMGYTIVRELIRSHIGSVEHALAWQRLAELLLMQPEDALQRIQPPVGG